MPLGWKPQSIEIYKEWVEVLLTEAQDELTLWELQFVANIESRLINGEILTEAQADKLESIYAAKTK